MPFDVYVQTAEHVRGLKIFERDNQKVYVNVTGVQEGQHIYVSPGSYEFLSEDGSQQSIQIDNDGIKSENLLGALLHYYRTLAADSPTPALLERIKHIELALKTHDPS
ncbi:hypothetical protein ACE5JW_11560 [Acinetobacter radioresistens]|jgi:hypothetical protein|uniref:hypothetical protein n=1 Tax=Acinetobacter TaxID=469 RepID=UPI0002CF5C3F|nr:MULTISPECIES: hypothetical protein [Acinetobacter]ENV88183.1 hypothetical protein F940_00029 [Acinetobacter radioresistens NIPH 2130]EXB80132.1 hypothetical protein J538_3053 [Acinetobacter sp. 272263]MCK4078596.1 hypothetical protein [Acinetobacter radioresistens]MCK4084886.1 hypothetical protein [Acinetobacter radioresistens]MCK4097215.1 hypothetical protein [Acinetobacter radioresistens]